MMARSEVYEVWDTKAEFEEAHFCSDECEKAACASGRFEDATWLWMGA